LAKKTSPSFRKIVLRLLVICAFYAVYLATLGESDMPPLQNGDLVFQSAWSGQTMAIALASNSVYIHTGVVADNGEGKYSVVEAGLHVQETPFHDWVQHGILRRFAVYRYKDLTPEQGGKIVATARTYIGIPYDFYFSPGKDAIYCSELDYLAYNESGVDLGKPEKIGTLNINNRYVKSIIEQRWKDYPACKGDENITFDQCYDRIMEGDIITPQAIANDPHLKKIFSNYP
jgi:uncharacterized protein YycO